MAERKSLTKKVRFEVFKRDSFTCQYCGSKAPDVILEIDHMNPVSKGGKNEILNLITSCFDCNRGKSDRKISDKSIVEKQREQIEELNLRRQQLEMILEWKTGLLDIKESEVEKARQYIEVLSKVTVSLTDTGLKNLSKVVKKFGINETLEAAEIAFEKYYTGDHDSFEVAFKKIGAIANLNRQPPHLKKIAYAKGILRNRIYFNDKVGHQLILDYYNAGYCLDHLVEYCKVVKHWTIFKEWISDLNPSTDVKTDELTF